jgi:hypothetical protein
VVEVAQVDYIGRHPMIRFGARYYFGSTTFSSCFLRRTTARCGPRLLLVDGSASQEEVPERWHALPIESSAAFDFFDFFIQ